MVAAEARRLTPTTSVASYRIILSHFRNKQDIDLELLAAMKAGGIPEWPYGFTADDSDKLSAEEIRGLAFGRTWQGRLENGSSALTQIQPNGTFAFRTTNSYR